MCLFCFSSEPLSPDEAKGGQSVLAVLLLVTVRRLHTPIRYGISTPYDILCGHDDAFDDLVQFPC